MYRPLYFLNLLAFSILITAIPNPQNSDSSPTVLNDGAPEGCSANDFVDYCSVDSVADPKSCTCSDIATCAQSQGTPCCDDTCKAAVRKTCDYYCWPAVWVQDGYRPPAVFNATACSSCLSQLLPTPASSASDSSSTDASSSGSSTSRLPAVCQANFGEGGKCRIALKRPYYGADLPYFGGTIPNIPNDGAPDGCTVNDFSNKCVPGFPIAQIHASCDAGCWPAISADPKAVFDSKGCSHCLSLLVQQGQNGNVPPACKTSFGEGGKCKTAVA